MIKKTFVGIMSTLILVVAFYHMLLALVLLVVTIGTIANWGYWNDGQISVQSRDDPEKVLAKNVASEGNAIDR